MLKEADFLKAASLFTASSPSYNGFLMAGKRRVELCEVPEVKLEKGIRMWSKIKWDACIQSEST